jgi:LemA protein
MFPTLITAIVIIGGIVLWVISTQRRLVVFEENTTNAMSQIGVQLSSRFDALIAILDITKNYAKYESEIMIETIKTRRSVITAKSKPDDVLHQEKIIKEALEKIAIISDEHSELKTNKNYVKNN